jgi:hypothetical protein
MDAKHFDAWTRRRVGLPAGSVFASLVAVRHAGGPFRREAASGRRVPLLRRLILLAPALALLTALLLASPALSKVLVGTDDSETLIGTKRNDQITGKGGQDILKGRAGNDTYFFADDWGQDFLIEGRRGGTDTLNFTGVTGNALGVVIVREFDQLSIIGPNNEQILADDEAGIPYVERIIGGQGASEAIQTGGGPNTLMPGGGDQDILADVGGYDQELGSGPRIPASNDTYAGFSSNTGRVTIRDWGGTDVVDMRPTSSSSVTMTAIDDDGENGTKESLEITRNSDQNRKIVINAHFGPYDPLSSDSGMNGRIEKLIFADKTFTPKNPPPLD